MNIEALIQNVINLFVIAIILEAAIMAIFKMRSLSAMESSRAFEASRDGIIIIICLFLCYKVGVLRLFKGTGIVLPRLIDIVISALVLARMTSFVGGFMSKMKGD